MKSMLKLLARWASFSVLASLLGGVAHAAIVPYLQTASDTGIWVTWKTETGTESTVQYGLTPGSLGATKSGTTESLGPAYEYHSVQLTGLTPNTTYYYRARTGSETSETYSFKTQPVPGASTGTFRVLVVGDNQIKNPQRYKELVTRARATLEQKYGEPLEQAINVVLNVGDQVDVGTLDHYENVHFSQSAPLSPNVPIQTTVGNHETYYDTGLALYRAHFHYEDLAYQGILSPGGDAYYANQMANVLFMHLNSEDTSATQNAWISDVVDAASSDEDVDWIVSLSHRPYQAEQYVGDISSWLRNSVMPVLSRTSKHVLNIGAHHHLYARGVTLDWPMYHIISGGSAWDQFWGQSNEQDFADVDKTVANWAWQVIEFDLAAREMVVESYAEAHPRLGFVYNSRLIDRFHRKLDLGPPATPAILNAFSAPLDLSTSQVIETSPFSSSHGETLHSVQFQVASDSDFQIVRLDRTQQVVNVYGDTGTPTFEPTDIGFGGNATRLTLPALALANGGYHLRVRHRDNNTLWSAWSAPRTFTVTGSSVGAPTVLSEAPTFETGQRVGLFYENALKPNPTWIGIFREGQTPGQSAPSAFIYPLPAASGQVELGPLTRNDSYFAVMFQRVSASSNIEISPRVRFFYGDIPELTLNGASPIQLGQPVNLQWAGSPGNAQDWIGIYRVGATPGTDTSTAFQYATGSAGTLSFADLPKGYYEARMFVNNTYTQIGNTVEFVVNDPASPIASAMSVDSSFEPGDPIVINFADGPGTPKDYVGIFRAGAVPGVDVLVTYLYVDGSASGAVTFTETLPPGEYFAALYINDSYTEVSNRVAFTVSGAPAPTPSQVPVPWWALCALGSVIGAAVWRSNRYRLKN